MDEELTAMPIMPVFGQRAVIEKVMPVASSPADGGPNHKLRACPV
jgi:hypothetical protein